MLSSCPPPLFTLNLDGELSGEFDPNEVIHSPNPFTLFANDIVTKPLIPVPVPLVRSNSYEDLAQLIETEKDQEQIEEQKTAAVDSGKIFLDKFFSLFAQDSSKKIPKYFTFSFGDIFISEHNKTKAFRWHYSQEAPIELQLNLFHILFHTLDLNLIKLILQYTFDESADIKNEVQDTPRRKTF